MWGNWLRDKAANLKIENLQDGQTCCSQSHFISKFHVQWSHINVTITNVFQFTIAWSGLAGFYSFAQIIQFEQFRMSFVSVFRWINTNICQMMTEFTTKKLFVITWYIFLLYSFVIVYSATAVLKSHLIDIVSLMMICFDAQFRRLNNHILVITNDNISTFHCAVSNTVICTSDWHEQGSSTLNRQ